MKAVAVALALTLTASPALAQTSNHPIADAAAAAATSAAAAPSSHDGRRKLFWPGLALSIAGVTTGVLATTVARVEDNSSGNAPPGAYQACVALKQNPIYAGSDCEALKAKNVKLLAAGVALGAAGAALMIGSRDTNAAISPGAIRFAYRVRF